MRHWWKVAVAVPLVLAVMWGLGIPGRAAPGGPDAPAAIAAKARAAEAAAGRALAAKLAASLALAPKGKPARSLTFSGTRLDTKIWETCYPGWNPSTGCTNFGNKEYQWYMPGQDRVSGGTLQLVAQRTPTPGKNSKGKPVTYGCRSGLVSTYNSFRFKYGFLQVVARITHGRGLWAALWLAAANNTWPPEMDLIESWGPPLNFAASFFHPTPATAKQLRSDTLPQTLSEGWQVYSIRWTRTSMKYWIGTRLVMDIKQKIPHQEMYFLADVASFLKPKAGNCSGTMEIRSVKYWK